jgi:hypothetical protein
MAIFFLPFKKIIFFINPLDFLIKEDIMVAPSLNHLHLVRAFRFKASPLCQKWRPE